MRDAPSRSGSSTTDSAASETAPQLAQPATAQPDTLAPAVPAAPADPSEAERARGTELYKQGDWQVHACFLMHPNLWNKGPLQLQKGVCTAGIADFVNLFSHEVILVNSPVPCAMASEAAICPNLMMIALVLRQCGRTSELCSSPIIAHASSGWLFAIAGCSKCLQGSG